MKLNWMQKRLLRKAFRLVAMAVLACLLVLFVWFYFQSGTVKVLTTVDGGNVTIVTTAVRFEPSFGETPCFGAVALAIGIAFVVVWLRK